MKKTASIVTALALLTAVLSGCGENSEATSSSTSSEKGQSTVTTTGDYTQEKYVVDEASITCEVKLNGESAEITGLGASESDGIVTISKAGVYRVTGELTEGQLFVNATNKDDVTIILNGVTITNSSSAAIYSKQSDKTTIILADGTQNTLTDGAEYIYAEGEDEPNAALFVKDDVTIKGSGSLNVNASYNNGIGTKDNLLIEGGIITVTAPNDAIKGKDGVDITGGEIVLTAQNDGIQADNADSADVGYINISGGKFTITAEHDAIQAESSLTISGGDFTIVTLGGHENADSMNSEESYKGIKAAGDINISGGSFNINSADDSVHSNSNIVVNADFVISSGDDGIHADGDLTVSGGSIDIKASYEGLEGTTVTVDDGVIYLTARDDGINSAGGSVNDEATAAEDGAITQTLAAAPAEPPSGEAPNGEAPNGEAPNGEAPNGEAPSGFGGGRRTDSFKGGGFGGFGGANADNKIVVNGGYIYVNAEGDGIDSNGSIEINGGRVIVDGPTNTGNGGLDYDMSCTVSGGVLICSDSGQMSLTPGGDSGENTIAVYFSTNQSANQRVSIVNSAGEVVGSVAPSVNYGFVSFTSPEITEGESYGIVVGGEAASADDYGYAEDGSLTGGEETGRVTAQSGVTSVSESGAAASGGGFGGGRGGFVRQ